MCGLRQKYIVNPPVHIEPPRLTPSSFELSAPAIDDTRPSTEVSDEAV